MNPVAMHPLLREVARAHAEHMVQNNYFGYEPPGGAAPSQWLEQPVACGFPLPLSEANLAAGMATPQQVFQALAASEGTCVNLHAPGEAVGVAHHAGDGRNDGSPPLPVWVIYVAPLE